VKFLINLLIFLPLNLVLLALWGIQYVLLFTVGALGFGLARLGGYENEMRPLTMRIQSGWLR
jgi:hypothetical protein